MDHALIIGIVVVLWWSATGLILWLDSQPRATYAWSLGGATVVAAIALYGIGVTRSGVETSDAYIAFLCTLALWGWQELAFLTGAVTGPRKHSCEDHCAGWRHFLHGCQAILYHELMLLFCGLAVLMLTWEKPNQTAAWTFLVLWGMRQSAKLNLHFGVRNLGLEFLPPQLSHLACYFRRKPMNPLWPVSIGLPAAVLVELIVHIGTPGLSEFDVTAGTIVATLLALGMLEHVFLVIPWPTSWLWGRRPATTHGNTLVDPAAAKSL